MASRTLSSKLSEAESGLVVFSDVQKSRYTDEVGSPSKGMHMLAANITHAAQAAGSAVLYAVVAISMNFVNKATMQQFPVAMTVLFLQMVATMLVMVPLQQCGFIKLGPFSFDKMRSLTLITILYTSNTAFALIGLRSLNIPMYSTLKRITPVMVLVAKSCMKRQWPSWNITASVLMVMFGCIIAGIGDFTFDWTGYGCALLSCTLQASYLLLVEHSGAERGMGSAELLFYSALLSAPVLLVLSVATSEVSQAVSLAALAARTWSGAHSLAWLLIASSFCGCLLNYSLFLCTVSNNALTTTIVGVLKGVIATFLGFFLLGGVQFHWVNVVGVLLNTIGGVWYTVIHYNQKYSISAARGAPGFPASASMEEMRQFNPVRQSTWNLPALLTRTQPQPHR